MQDQGVANWPEATVMVNDASKHNANGAKFNDWRLPTKDELNLIFLQEESIGGFLNYYYWSSTEYEEDNSGAWMQYFYNGNQSASGKGAKNLFRAVRAF